MRLSNINPLRMAGEVEAAAEARKARQDECEHLREGSIEVLKEQIADELIQDPVRLGEVYYDAVYEAQKAAGEVGVPQALDALMARAMMLNRDASWTVSNEELGKAFRAAVNAVMDAWIEAEAERRVD